MWISKKKWNQLEKRVADLEGQVQGQKLKKDLIRNPYDKRFHYESRKGFPLRPDRQPYQ